MTLLSNQCFLGSVYSVTLWLCFGGSPSSSTVTEPLGVISSQGTKWLSIQVTLTLVLALNLVWGSEKARQSFIFVKELPGDSLLRGREKSVPGARQVAQLSQCESGSI